MRRTLLGGQGLLAALLACGVANAADMATIEIKPHSKWDGGYAANVLIHNNSSKQIEKWTLSFDISTPLRSASSAKMSGKGPYKFRSVDYNSDIRAGGTERFGIVADGPFAEARPRDCRLNGDPCRFVWDEEKQPELRSVSSPTATEGSPLDFLVALSGKTIAAMPLSIELKGIEAALGVDTKSVWVQYPGQTAQLLEGQSAQLNLPAGIDQFTLRVDTVKDAVVEGAERLSLNAGAIASGQASPKWAQGVGTIRDADVLLPELSISSASAAKEGEKASCVVSLNAAAASGAVTVKYETVAVSATQGDYATTAGQLIFTAAGSQTVSVPLLTDAINPEPDEVVKLRLNDATGAKLGNAECAITIRNVEPPKDARLTVQDAGVVTEGDTASFVVRLAGTPAEAVKVKYQTVDGDAKALAGDYVATTGELNFLKGVADQSATVKVNTLKDSLSPEAAEFFLLRLSEAKGATIEQADAKATITDLAGVKVSVTGSASPVKEGELAKFVITLSSKPSAPVELDYATVDGKAVAGSDYTRASGHLVFAKGDTNLTREVSVQTTVDSANEGNESFSLTLAKVTGADVLSGTAEATVTDVAPVASVYKRTFEPMTVGSLWLKNLESAKIKNEGKNGPAGPDAKKGEPDVVIGQCPGATDQKCLEVRYHHGDDKGGVIKNLPTSPAYVCNSSGDCPWVVNSDYTNTGTDVYQRAINIPEKDAPNETGTALDAVKPAKAYTLSYDIYFDKDFDFARGGKLPGLAAAQPDSGCTDDSSDKRGPDNWSVRLMWRANGRLELYSYDQSRVEGKCGNRYIMGVLTNYLNTTDCTNEIPGSVGKCLQGKEPPANVFRFRTETWYTIRLSVQVNDKIIKREKGEPAMDGGDGKITLFVRKRGSSEPGETIELTNVPLRDQCDKDGKNCVNQIQDKPATQVNAFFFSTFFGGNETKRKTCLDPSLPQKARASLCADQDSNPYNKYTWVPTRRSVAYFDNIEIRDGYMNREKISQF